MKPEITDEKRIEQILDDYFERSPHPYPSNVPECEAYNLGFDAGCEVALAICKYALEKQKVTRNLAAKNSAATEQ